MEDLILILVLSGIGLVTLLVSVWLFYRKKRKTAEKKSACTAECRGGHCGRGKLSCQEQVPSGKGRGGLFPWHIFSAVQAAPLGKRLPWG